MKGTGKREKAQRTEATELTQMLEHRAKRLEQLYKTFQLNRPTLQETKILILDLGCRNLQKRTILNKNRRK